MTRIIPALVVTLALVVTPVAHAQSTVPDRLLFDHIASQVERYTQYTVFDSVTASVDNGHVILAGWVTMAYKRDDIELRIKRLDGIRTIESRIEVLPSSIDDDRLRFRIARAIYGNSMFWHYASLPNPPIKVIVNDGHVILDGVVGSNVERALARSLASGFGASTISNRLWTDTEVRERLPESGVR